MVAGVGTSVAHPTRATPAHLNMLMISNEHNPVPGQALEAKADAREVDARVVDKDRCNSKHRAMGRGRSPSPRHRTASPDSEHARRCAPRHNNNPMCRSYVQHTCGQGQTGDNGISHHVEGGRWGSVPGVRNAMCCMLRQDGNLLQDKQKVVGGRPSCIMCSPVRRGSSESCYNNNRATWTLSWSIWCRASVSSNHACLVFLSVCSHNLFEPNTIPSPRRTRKGNTVSMI